MRLKLIIRARNFNHIRWRTLQISSDVLPVFIVKLKPDSGFEHSTHPLLSLPSSVSDKHTNTSCTDAHPAVHNHSVLCWYGCNVVYSGSETERFYTHLSTVVNIVCPVHMQTSYERLVWQPPALYNYNTLHTTLLKLNYHQLLVIVGNCWLLIVKKTLYNISDVRQD